MSRCATGSGGGRAARCYSDAVGELTADGADAHVVPTRRGPVRVQRAAVVAVRAVPPAPPRRAPLAAVVRLEGMCADAWPAQVDRPLGRGGCGRPAGTPGARTARSRSATPACPSRTRSGCCAGSRGSRGYPPRVQAPVGSPWDRAVAEQGWVLDTGHEAGAEVAVLVAPLDGATDPRVELAEHPSPEWWGLALGAAPTAAQRHVLDPGGRPPTAFALLRGPAGEAIGWVRATAVEDHLHLSLLEVAAAARRRGAATALLASVATWGQGHGARWTVVQVALHDAGARAFYDRLGYVEHHRYRYLVPPA